MSAHGRTGKALEQYHEKKRGKKVQKPSYQKRLGNRAKSREEILKLGDDAQQKIPAIIAHLTELKETLKTCAPDEQKEIEAKISAAHATHDLACADVLRATELQNKLAGYQVDKAA